MRSWLLASRPILLRRARSLWGCPEEGCGCGAELEGRGLPGHTAGAGWAGAERPIIGPERETQMGGIEQGGSERVARAAGPATKRNPAPPFLRRKDPRRRCVIGTGREWSIWQEPVPAKIDEEKSSNKPPRHEVKGAMLAISRLKYHFRRFVPPTVAVGLPCWAAPSGTYWRRFAHCPLAGSSQPLHCSCPCRG